VSTALSAPTATSTAPASRGAADASFVLRRLGGGLLTTVLSLVILGLAWQLALAALHANPYIAKTPGQVISYLFSGNPAASISGAQVRSQMGHLLLATLGDAAIGFVFGAGGSCLIALLFSLVEPLEMMFMPTAMLLRTVPLLSIAPVIFLIFGNGKVTAAFIGGVVVFFPLLVNVTLGLRAAAPLSVDLVRVYGGGRLAVLRMVAFPTALPYLFASLRIAAPLAVGGAMLYEWLFTFKGLGAGIVAAKVVGNYDQVWAIALVTVVVCVILYVLMSLIESLVLAVWGPNAGQPAGR
jgi:ABC-type nitrate/sulfonate/bicarbonate transport system permease component